MLSYQSLIFAISLQGLLRFSCLETYTHCLFSKVVPFTVKLDALMRKVARVVSCRARVHTTFYEGNVTRGGKEYPERFLTKEMRQ